MRVFLGVLGVIVAIGSSFFVMFAIGDLITGGDGKTTVGVLLGLLTFFLGTGFAGVKLAMIGFRSQPAGPVPVQLTELDKEQRVLALAGAMAGRVTASEVALNCQLSLTDSKATLDRLVSYGAAEMQLTDDGVVVYTFTGFLPRDRYGNLQQTLR
jgi:hypothetical protein